MNSAVIVEPDPALRRRLVGLLARCGWQVDAVGRVDQALRLLDHPPAHVVYINEVVDGDAGYLLLFAIRARLAWESVRVVMAGVGEGDRHAACAAELGADGYLTLPASPAEVLHAVVRRRGRDAMRRDGALARAPARREVPPGWSDASSLRSARGFRPSRVEHLVSSGPRGETGEHSPAANS